jgi:hypothetical protein
MVAEYDNKERTTKDFKKELQLSAKTRNECANLIGQYFTLLGTSGDIETAEFVKSMSTRFLKTSKIIEDCTLVGAYIEAASLLRRNYEIAAYTLSCLTMKDENKRKKVIEDFQDIRKDLRESSIGNIKDCSDRVGLNYNQFKFLCGFAHPHMHKPDTGRLVRKGASEGAEEGDRVYIQEPTFGYSHNDAMHIIRINNELLMYCFIRSYHLIMALIKDEADKIYSRIKDQREKDRILSLDLQISKIRSKLAKILEEDKEFVSSPNPL